MEKIKTNFYKYALLVLSIIMFSFTLVACGNPEPPAWSKNYTLPEKETALEKLVDIYGSEEAIFLLQTNTIRRMKCPENGEYITLNFKFTPNDYAKLLFEDSVQEFNDVFSVINPNYKFKINYSPSQEDFEEYYSIRVQTVQAFSSSTTLGTAPMSYAGDYICNFGINIKESVLNNGSQIMSVFKHELMHLLGAGDAYKNENATKDTIMQGYNPNGNFSFSNTDVAFLDTLYRNPDAPYSDEYISSYIANYQTTNTHTKAKNVSMIYTKFLKDLNGNELKEQIDSLSTADTFKNDLKSKINNSLSFDTNFGQTSVNLGELPYQTSEYNVTEYSHCKLDIETRSYWWSRHRYGGMSFGNNGVYLYTYEGGIMVLGLNSTLNMDFIVKIDNYAIALSKQGDFNNLDNLSASVHKVYEVTDMTDTAWFNYVDNYATI